MSCLRRLTLVNYTHGQTIAFPLNTLISSLILSPDLVALIRDTLPGDAWLPAIAQLEDKIIAVKGHGNVKAAHEVAMVVEGLKAKVSNKRCLAKSLSRSRKTD